MKIGFGHRSGHGKDTACKFLQTHLNVLAPHIKVKKVNFADKLKEVAYDLYAWAGVHRGIHYENCREDRAIVLPALGCTVVDLWVDIGEKMREICQNTWINYVEHQASTCDILLTADVRHFSEAEICDVLYKIENPRVPKREGKSIDDVLEDYDAWTSVISNSGSIKRLNLLMEGYAKSLIRRIEHETLE